MKIYATHILRLRRGTERITLEIESPDTQAPLYLIENEMVSRLLAMYPGFELFEYRCKIVDPEEPPF